METEDYRQLHDDWTFRNVVHISHGDLFRAIDLTSRGLGPVKKAVERDDLASAYAAWDGYFRTRKKHLDFFDPEEFRALAIDRPKQVRKIRRAAADICRHRIRWYGQRVEQFGNIVDFSPGTDRSALYGYHYWYWAHALLYAYALDGGVQYAEAFDRLFNQWYDQRDSVEWRLKADPIWYELGLCRNNRFIAFYSLFRDEPGLRRITRERLLRTLLGHGRQLYHYARQTRIGDNRQFNATLALLHLALAMPEFKESGRWLRAAASGFVRMLKNSVYADGGLIERCPSYSSFSVAFAAESYRLLGGRPEYASLRERIGRLVRPCYEWYMHIATPLGEFPPVGDAKTRSAVPMLTAGVAAFDLDAVHASIAPNQARIAREQLPVQYSHRMREADLSARKMSPSALPENPSRHFPDSGWSVMRTDWKPTAHYLLIDHGPCAFHGHHEALSFNAYAFGEPQVLERDLAVRRGYDDPDCRRFRSALSHNQIVIDDANLKPPEKSIPADLWSGRDVVWHSDGLIDYFEARHLGYQPLKGVVIRRRILFVKPHFWLVHDRVACEEYPVEVPGRSRAKMAHCYLHACHPFAPRKGRWVSTGDKSRLNVMSVEAGAELQFESGLDSRGPRLDLEKEDLYRDYYPDRHWMRLSQPVSRKPCDFCAVLYPQRKSDRASVRAERVPVTRQGQPVKPADALACRVVHGRQSHLVFLNHSNLEGESEAGGEPVSGRVCVAEESGRRRRGAI